MPTEKEKLKTLRKCPHFDRCNQNLCPLDFELSLRSGKESDKCRWMREAKKTKIGDKEFISGGTVMADAILIFVPGGNLKWLNNVSQKRWLEIQKS